MTLPKHVKDVTQTEWLDVRERLARVEAERDAAEHRAGCLYTDAKQWNEAMAELAEARHRADQLASQLALAMTWGAEVCATSAKAREHLVALQTVASNRWPDEPESFAASVRDVMGQFRERAERAERAEAERDALLARLGSPDTHPGIAWQSLNRERDDARERAQGAECEVQSWKDECGRWEERTADVEARLLAVTAERDEARACWHRDVAKGRAAIEKREADLADARRHLAAVVAAARDVCREGLGVEHGLCSASALGELLPALDAALADAAQAAREHAKRGAR